MNYIEQKKLKKQQGFKELRRIKTKFLHAGYPSKFINDTFFEIQQRKRRIVNTEMVT